MYERNFYTADILTKTDKVKRSFPKLRNGDIDLSAMGETGERAFACSLFEYFKGEDYADLGLPSEWFGGDRIPITTNILVKLGMLSEKDERSVQLWGIDVIVLKRQSITDRVRLTAQDIFNYPNNCIQVKFQLKAPNYRNITVETGTDEDYVWNKVYDDDSPSVKRAGINKTAARWTAYIVSGGTILFMETEKLREHTNDHTKKYIGTVWRKGYETKRAVGYATSILALLKAGVAKPFTVGKVFRDYFSKLQDIKCSVKDQDQHSWKFFIQDWTPAELLTFLEANASALPDERVRGDKTNNDTSF